VSYLHIVKHLYCHLSFFMVIIMIMRLLRVAVTEAAGYISQKKIRIHNIMLRYNTC